MMKFMTLLLHQKTYFICSDKFGIVHVKGSEVTEGREGVSSSGLSEFFLSLAQVG